MRKRKSWLKWLHSSVFLGLDLLLARGQELTICTALPGTSTDSEHRKLETWVSRTCGDLRDGEREGLRWRWPFKRSECGEENGDEDMTKSSKGVKDREKE